MVAGAGRDAHVRDIVAHGDGGHERLGAVAARHPYHVRAAFRHRVLSELRQIVTLLKDDGLDAPPTCLLDQAEPLHLAAPELGFINRTGRSASPTSVPGVTPTFSEATSRLSA